jgi:hypothetical protein
MTSMYAAQPDNGLHGVVWLDGVLRDRHYEFQPAQVAAVACAYWRIISGDMDAYRRRCAGANGWAGRPVAS